MHTKCWWKTDWKVATYRTSEENVDNINMDIIRETNFEGGRR
jgi:hypothetical protein